MDIELGDVIALRDNTQIGQLFDEMRIGVVEEEGFDAAYLGVRFPREKDIVSVNRTDMVLVVSCRKGFPR